MEVTLSGCQSTSTRDSRARASDSSCFRGERVDQFQRRLGVRLQIYQEPLGARQFNEALLVRVSVQTSEHNAVFAEAAYSVSNRFLVVADNRILDKVCDDPIVVAPSDVVLADVLAARTRPILGDLLPDGPDRSGVRAAFHHNAVVPCVLHLEVSAADFRQVLGIQVPRRPLHRHDRHVRDDAGPPSHGLRAPPFRVADSDRRRRRGCGRAFAPGRRPTCDRGWM